MDDSSSITKKKTCRQCNTVFNIADRDIAFLNSIAPTFGGKTFFIPLPDQCPQCRFQQRLVWRPELHLFKRKSDKSGKTILSFLPEEAPCTVYSPEEWWSDDWDPIDYGRDFDFSRPFFEQFQELLYDVPIVSLSIGGQNVNSDFLNSASWLKNCYLLAGANHNEDCYYGNFVNSSTNCMDCSFVDHCELCYQCIDCTKCYNLRYSQQCSNCSDSSFLFACRNCSNCFGCVNMTEKKYCYLNEQLTKEEYEKRLQSAQLHRRSRVQEADTFFQKHRLQFPHKHMIGEMNEDVTGNAILRSRRCFDCFDVSDSEDCHYCGWFHQAKNCMDCYAWGLPAEECYFSMEVGDNSYRALFSTLIYNGHNVLYSVNCRASSDLFGCVSLKRGKHCIFNKQYTEKEYGDLARRILEHMEETGEWGQFFPMSLCPMAYNQSIAQDYFPLSKKEATTLGARWNEEEESATPQTAPIPDTIAETDDAICKEVFTCSETGKPHRIIPQEYAFYKENTIPIPTKCWFARHMERLRKRNPRKLYDRTCAKCSTAIETTYAPERKERIFCEECYLDEVY